MLDDKFAFGVALSTILVCLVNFVYTIIQKRTSKTQNKIYLIILGILVANSVSIILTALCKSGVFPESTAWSVNEFAKHFYFACHTALCPMFFYYVSSVSGVRFKLGNIGTLFYSGLFIISELLALTNPLTGWVYTINSNMTTTRNWGEYFIYLTALVYFILTFVIMFSSWEILSAKRKGALVFFFLFVATGVILQLLFKDLKIEVLTEAVGFTGVLIAVENEDDRIDFGMGFYNRAALNLDLKSCFLNNRFTAVIVIRITNSEIISKLVGSENAYIISEIVGPYLKTIVKTYNIYAPTPGTFVLTLFEKNAMFAEETAEVIRKRFEEPWDYEGKRIPFSTVVMMAKIPEQLKDTAQIFYMIDIPIPANTEKKVFMNEDLTYIFRRQSVESALSRGLEEGSFEVYYQPTYHLDRTLHGAEALIRMHDKEMGNLYPDEFIPIAEQIGLIDDIDDFVLEEVCKFIKSGFPESVGMECINVNLSVLQCIRPGFLERICGIVERVGVEKKLINFEITESISSDDYDTLSNVILELKERGFKFSMDDYGTGYSNVSAVFSLNLDVVKLDKSLLWNAEKSELGLIILGNTIRMIRQMKKEILVEGVETEAQIELLTTLKVDYLQGFYFSKPIPKDDFIALVGAAES